MSKIKVSEIAEETRELMDERQAHMVQAIADRQYYLGNQITDEMAEILESRGQAPLVIQITKPAIDHELAILSSQAPGPRFFAVGSGDEGLSTSFNDVYAWNHQINYGNFQIMKAMEFGLSMGMGYIHVWPDYDADWGRGEVKWKYEHPLYVYVDPSSRDFLLRDARMIQVVTYIPKDILKDEFGPEYAREIDKLETFQADQNEIGIGDEHAESGRPVFGDGVSTVHTQNLVKRVDRYCKVDQELVSVLDVRTGDVHFLPATSLENPQLEALVAQGIVRVKLIRVMVPYLQIFLGDQLEVFGDFCPGTEYPVIPFYNIYTDRPYGLSEVSQIEGMQDFVNKSYSQIIYNVSVSGNTKIMYEEDSIDEKLWNKRYSTPGALLPYRRTALNKPHEVQPGQIPGGLLAMVQNVKYDAQYALSTFAMQMGDAGSAPSTYRGTLSLDEMGQRRLILKKLGFDSAISQMGTVLRDHIQAVYSGPKAFRILRNNGEVGEVAVNMPTGEQPKSEFEDIPTLNDIANTQFDMVIEIGKMRPSNRMAEAAFYMELMQSGVLDPKAVRDKVDLDDREAIETRMNTAVQLQELAEEQQAYIDELEKEIGQGQDKQLNLKMQVEIEKLRTRLERIIQDAKGRLQNAQTKDDAERQVERARVAAETVKRE